MDDVCLNLNEFSSHEKLEDCLKLAELLCKSYLRSHDWTGSLVVDIDDTIIQSNGNKPIVPMISFLHAFLDGFEISAAKDKRRAVHLVTARPIEMREDTEKQLKYFKIPYTTLSLMPYKAVRFIDIGHWKDSERERISQRSVPIVMTIGDMWTDLKRVFSNAQLTKLEKDYGSETEPYIIVRLGGRELWGVKLKEA